LPWTFTEELFAPLLRLLHGDGRLFVLAISQNSVRLFQATRFTVSPADLKGVPHTLAEALVTHDTDNVLTFHSRPTSGGSWGAIFEGRFFVKTRDFREFINAASAHIQECTKRLLLLFVVPGRVVRAVTRLNVLGNAIAFIGVIESFAMHVFDERLQGHLFVGQRHDTDLTSPYS
jgi:hypothetical protein